MNVVIDTATLAWPTEVAIAADRILAGSPAASTIVLHTTTTTELGLWRVSPGEFSTVHDGYEEFIQIVEGDADLIHDDGTVIPLSPGSVVLLEAGWRGRWLIRRPLVKTYTTVARA